MKSKTWFVEFSNIQLKLTFVKSIFDPNMMHSAICCKPTKFFNWTPNNDNIYMLCTNNCFTFNIYIPQLTSSCCMGWSILTFLKSLPGNPRSLKNSLKMISNNVVTFTIFFNFYEDFYLLPEIVEKLGVGTLLVIG